MRKAGMQESRNKNVRSSTGSRSPTFLLGSCIPAFLRSSWGAIACTACGEGSPREIRPGREDSDGLHCRYARINTDGTKQHIPRVSAQSAVFFCSGMADGHVGSI